eukprot:CAMPEP_0175244340 /NCGR_PEP_ID=MMETSP0093-20121207/32037_1 /TAXON_ID=311494 /ORGANISM="Alexandrium monilatum, Strain CCMP3105" /LENGTH=72 /DNA_ID=CAMNT_0016538451 /DNA_START=35 /DNA_END=253 /DNA_ORIENTATION=+
MWNDLVARVKKEIGQEGLSGFLAKCGIAVGIGLLHWLATGQKEEAEDIAKKLAEKQEQEQLGPRVGKRPKAD